MYLVTGGAGFIGSHIVERLVSMGKSVRVFDNFSFGSKENLNGIGERVEILSGDLLDLDAVQKAMEGVQVVFHQAALRSVPFSVEHPSLVNRVNVEGTLNVLTAARDAKAGRVVFASSSSVYGEEKKLPSSEQQLPKPISPYAVSKLAGEHYCNAFTKLYGLKTVSLRYFNVFGPRQDPNSEYAAVIPRFILCALRGEPFQVHGDGLQSRDFTYIDNVVDANLLAAATREGVGGVFNVGQNRAYTLLDLIDLLRSVLKTELRGFHTDARSGDVRHTLADLSQSRRCLDYQPRISFEEGIVKTVKYFSRQMEVEVGQSIQPGF